jgi:uncharacterized protein involved in exopolysaccharide biosynthesis/Mrp family chromosome partitioning ATPase
MTISTFPPDRNVALSAMRHEPRFQIETKSDEFDLSSGLRLIRRRLPLIGALVALFMAIAIAMIWDLRPVYHAESRLMIHRPLATSLSGEDPTRGDALDLKSETERLLSRSIAERVIRDLKLDERPEFNPALQKTSLIGTARELLRDLIDSKEPASQPEQDSLEPIIPEYYEALRVWRDGEGNVIRIGFDATDPQLAAAVPNRIIEIYLEEQNDSIRHRLDTASEWIRQRISEQRGRVETARDNADRRRENVRSMLNEDTQDEQVKTVTELSDRQAKIEQTRAEAKSTISILEEASDVSLALQIISVPESIGGIEQNLRSQQRDLDRLLETYGDNAQAVIDMRATIFKTRKDLGTAVDQYVESLRVKLAALDREDEVIRSGFAAAQEQRSRSLLAQADLARLERMVDNEQATLNRLEEQRRALAGQAMLPAAEVEILAPAAVPIGPQGRGRLFYLLSALLGSISLAVTVAFVVELLDKTVRSFDQISEMPRIMPAGFIPRLKKHDWTGSEHSQDESFNDAIRTLIVSLKQSNGGKLPTSIVVTSAHRGEGRSLVARSLAIELVANGNSVLLVDGDFRRGNPDALFTSELDHGLNELLSGQAGIRDVIQHHDASGVDFISAGNPVLHHRAHSTYLAELIEITRSKGQIIIFDSPPVLSSNDTAQLAALTERTLFVVQWAKTSRRAMEFSLQHLRGSRNADVLITINSVNPKKHALYNFSDSGLLSGRPA